MNKKVSLILILFFCVSCFFLLSNEKRDLWIKAAAERDLTVKMQLFEQYEEKYGDDKKDKNIRFLYFNLAQTSFRLEKFEKTIEYGEIALNFEDMEDHYKLDLALWLANAFNLARKDYDKAFSYAQMVIDFGKAIKDMTDGRERAEELSRGVDKRYVAPALRIQVRILIARGIKDNKARMEVIQKSIAAFKLDTSVAFCNRIVIKESIELAKKNMINEAIESIEQVVNKEDLSFDVANIMAKLYYRRFSRGKSDDDKNKAIEYYEIAYDKKKTASLAAKIGQLLSKKDKDKAILYFAEAFVLSKSDKSTDAFKYLQQLWFKDKAKDKSTEEQDAGFKEIIDAAQNRLNRKDKS
jgi:tetratricopeptide (TPR) repeat protein